MIPPEINTRSMMSYDTSHATARSPKRRRARPIFAWFVLVMLCAGLIGHDATTTVHAQQMRPANTGETAAVGQTNTLVLQSADKDKDYDLARHALTVTEGAGNTGYQQVIQRYRDNELSRTNTLPMIRLGLRSAPYWLVVPIQNASDQAQWVLDFGRLSQGRSGLLAEAYVFEHNQQVEILDALPRDGNAAPLGRQLQGSTVQLDLESGQQHLLVFYLRPRAGIPGTFRLHLQPRTATDNATSAVALKASDVVIYAPLGLFFILMGMFAVTRRQASVAGAIFYGLHGAYLFAFDQLVFTTGAWPFYVMLLSLPVAMLAGLVMLKDIYGLSRDNKAAAYLGLASLGALTVLGALTGCVIIALGSPLAGAVAVYSPVALTLAGTILMALNHDIIGKSKTPYPYYAHIGAWSILGLGFLASALAHMEMLPTGVYANNAYFYALIVNGVIMTGLSWRIFRPAAFNTHHDVHTEAAAETPIGEPGGVIEADKLYNSRHNAEHARLLRVIEREREILSQLRAQEKKRVEEMRKAKDAADNANDAKSAFLAVVSHEIRTPMTGIMGMVRLLENTQLTREQSEYVETIKDSGDAMMALLNDILDFEKIESGKLQLEMADFDVVRMLKDIHKLMSGHAEAKDSTLELKIDDNVPKYVVGDSSRLRQILLNLVNNAIKFTENGTITLQLSHLGQEADDRGSTIHQLYFAIRDTGIGISPEAQNKLFTPFSQASASITRKYGGTGLGLAICKRLVEAMGADISLKSQPGEGSTFFFTLEMPEGVAESAIESTDAAEALAGQGQTLGGVEAVHILIAEDNATNRKVIESFLAQQGHSSISVENGKKALEALENDRFDMLITDIEMQDMGGQELTRELRRNSDNHIANMPVVALTGNVRDEDIEAYREAGMNDVLAKPVTPEALDHTIRRIQHGETINAPATGGVAASQEPGSDTAQEQDDTETAAAEIALKGGDDNLQQESDTSGEQSQEEADVPSQTASQTACYDAQVLDTLKANTSTDGFQDMIESVFDETDKLLVALEEALSSEDWDSLRARAHELKGMSANFGLTRVAESAGSIEKALRHEESMDYAGELNTLREAASATREAVKAKLGQDNGDGVNTG